VNADDHPSAAPPGPPASVEGDYAGSAAGGADQPSRCADLASDDAPRLRHVVRRLLTPARAGFYLGRDDLARLGAVLGFPLPALDRRIMLEHLFVAAGPAGLLPNLLDLLAAEAEAYIAEYRAWEAAYPHAAPIWAEWRTRAETLRAELAALRAEATETAPPSSP
jgi:hypothetical protein